MARGYPAAVGRKRFGVLIVVSLIAAVVAIAVVSRDGGKPATPAHPGLDLRGAGEDNADLMRRLQRDKMRTSK
jgi:hypothetical protein